MTNIETENEVEKDHVIEAQIEKDPIEETIETDTEVIDIETGDMMIIDGVIGETDATIEEATGETELTEKKQHHLHLFQGLEQ